MKPSQAVLIYLLIPFLAALLAGCGTLGFSPEAVAIQSASRTGMRDFSIDPQSIQVTQRAEVGDAVIVQIKFSGLHSRTGQQACLGVYEMTKSQIGTWQSGGGGTGCTSGDPVDGDNPFSMGLTTFGGDRPNDPGYSIAHGETYDDTIARIRVNWMDGSTQEVDVVKQTYLAARAGQVQAASYDGLDADGNIVRSLSMGSPVPGKQ